MERNLVELSKNKTHELALLKQKKHRLARDLVVVDGVRVLEQMKSYGVKPLELYLREGMDPFWQDVPRFKATEAQMERICDSNQPQGIAGLFKLPNERRHTADIVFYLESLADPGNLGTVFRIAAAFGIGAIWLSPDCAEVSSAKVIRASLGAVYAVPFAHLEPRELDSGNCRLYVTAGEGTLNLAEFGKPQDGTLVIAFGSEARGASAELLSLAKGVLRIETPGQMESLNVAVSAGIVAYKLTRDRGRIIN